MKYFLIMLGLALLPGSCSKDCECPEPDDSSSSQNLLYPDGIMGEPVLFMEDSGYVVPEGKALYIHNCEKLSNEAGTEEYFIPGVFTNDHTYGTVIIIPPGYTVRSEGFLNGMLIDSHVELFTWYTDTIFRIPDDKTLYLTSFKTQYLTMDDIYVEVFPREESVKFKAPFIVPAGTILGHLEKHLFTGYLKAN